jgi:hypothetical protein
MPAASMAAQNFDTAFMVEADTLPPLAMTAVLQAAASGWTPEARGRKSLGFIGMGVAL